MAEITKKDVSDYINSIDEKELWTPGEFALLQQRIDPQLATMLIKLVGDVWWLVKIRENESTSAPNRVSIEKVE